MAERVVADLRDGGLFADLADGRRFADLGGGRRFDGEDMKRKDRMEA
jgi:hypothetical protein